MGEQTTTARDANTRAKPGWRSPHHKQTALLLLCGIILILYPGSAFAQARVKIETLSVATGAALDFDGSDDYVQRASSLVVGTNDFTIEAWINPVIGAGFSSVIAQDISGNAPSQFEVAFTPPPPPALGNYSTTSVPTATPSADLSITITDSQDPVTEGNNLTYTITVTNNGPDTATNITVNVTSNGALTFVSASAGCGQSVDPTCTQASLANGASVIFTITVTPNSPGTVGMNFTGSASENDPTSNIGFENTQVNAAVCTPPPAGMIAWYPGDGNADDVTGNGHNGTLIGGVTFTPGRVDQAFTFDGSTGYVTVPDNPLLVPSAAITVDAWVKTTDASGFHGLVSKYKHGAVTTDDSYNLSVLDGAAYWQVSTDVNPGGLSITSASIADGQWHHVAGTYDSSTGAQKLYIDGALVTSGSLTGTTINPGTGTALQLVPLT
ncbi:MAG TPA: LamG-like jellyroll fold domain-containing protein [Pyrinomonadaceae bacterium]